MFVELTYQISVRFVEKTVVFESSCSQSLTLLKLFLVVNMSQRRKARRSLIIEPILEVKDLHVEIDGKEVLKGITMSIYPGETHILFGPNGSGKSTFIKTLMGLR